MENIQGQTAANKKIKKSFADAGYRLDSNDVEPIDDVETCCYQCAKFGYRSTSEGSYKSADKRCYCFNICKY